MLENAEDDFDGEIRVEAPLVSNPQPSIVLSDTEAEEEARGQGNEPDGKDSQSASQDAGNCPICLEPWTSSGRHRICSLRCGHLFGRSCVDKWLASGHVKCPQCNAPAKRPDIRILYCRRLVALDTTEREGLEASLEAERAERTKADAALAKANLAAQLLKAELEQVKQQLARLQKRNSGGADSEDICFSSVRPHEFMRRVVLGASSSQYQCRQAIFDEHFGIFLIGRSDASKAHGVVKISVWDKAASAEFVALHEDAVRAIACSPHRDGLYLTVGADGKMNLVSLTSNSVVQTWRLPASPWSCAFDPHDRNFVYVGLGGGRIAVYDLRESGAESQPVAMLALSGLKRPALPIHSLCCQRRGRGLWLVGGTMDGPFVVGIADPQASFARFSFWTGDFGYQGVACASVAVKGSTLLASFRSLSGREESRHVVCTLQPDAPVDEATKKDEATKGDEATDLDADLDADRDADRDTANALTPIKFPFVEFRSQGAHRIPFRATLLPSPRSSAVYCLLGDEATAAGHIYAVDAERPLAGCERLAPVEVLVTNAGSAVLDCCWGVQQQLQEGADWSRRAEGTAQEAAEGAPVARTSCIGLLTEKHFYIYTHQL